MSLLTLLFFHAKFGSVIAISMLHLYIITYKNLI
nr:MAG TPA: hypothetical protein [Caudoviricetes sp.]